MTNSISVDLKSGLYVPQETKVAVRSEFGLVVMFINSSRVEMKTTVAHKIGFSIRLSCVLIKDFIDTVDELKNLVEFCKENDVEQLTIRPVRKPEKSEDDSVFNWTKNNEPAASSIKEINEFIRKEGKKLMTFSYGAEIYDLFGQNIAISDCLTIKAETDEIRQLIFFPDGHLRYDWQYKGAILM